MVATAVATSTRAGESGAVLAQVPVVAAVGAITHPSQVTVTGTSPALVKATAIAAQFDGAPSNAALGIMGAWITDPTTGAWAVRIGAIGADYAGTNENLLLQVLQSG